MIIINIIINNVKAIREGKECGYVILSFNPFIIISISLSCCRVLGMFYEFYLNECFNGWKISIYWFHLTQRYQWHVYLIGLLFFFILEPSDFLSHFLTARMLPY